jgi:CheY-like chemotaxis protein
VDDEEPIVRMTGKILTKLGYQAEAVSDPVAALAAFRQAPGKFDLIITDLTMPRMSGLEFATCASKENPQVKIILMTGFSSNLSPEQLQDASINEVLLKPVTMKALSQAVNRLLNNSKN